MNRAKQRLEKIRKDVYLFLLSPKDAFRQYNENRSGKMSFDEFKNLLIQLSQLSQSETLSLAIMRDIFEFIDIRRDGTLDIHEWMETFRRLEVINHLHKTTQPQHNLFHRRISQPRVMSRLVSRYEQQ